RCFGMLRTIEQLEDSVAAFDTRIEAALSPFLDIVERLREVPGLGATATETVIAEIGTDMSPLPTVGLFSRGRGSFRASTRAPTSASVSHLLIATLTYRCPAVGADEASANNGDTYESFECIACK